MRPNLYVSNLQYGSGVVGFLCHHRVDRFASSTAHGSDHEGFVSDIHRFRDDLRGDLADFQKREGKDDLARDFLAFFEDDRGHLFLAAADHGHGQPTSTSCDTRRTGRVA